MTATSRERSLRCRARLRIGAVLVALALSGPWGCGGDGESSPSSSPTVPATQPQPPDTTSGEPADTSTDPEPTGPEPTGPEPTPSEPPPEWTFSLPLQDWPAAFLSVSGTDADDVWVVGAEHEGRPVVLHWNGDAWERREAPSEHTLWWVHALDRELVFFAGEHGQVLRWAAGEFERMDTPSLARQTVFGIWARAPDDVYAVGGVGSRSGFIWHHDGHAWTSLDLPGASLPRLWHGATPALFKVWGDERDTFFVGGLGQVLRRRGDGPVELVRAEGEDTLFTVAGRADGSEVLAVGGTLSARVDRLVGEGVDSEVLEAFPLLQGIAFAPDGTPWASGAFGTLLRRIEGVWENVNTGLDVPGESLHAVWIDPSGNVWSVGGNVISAALDEGVLLHGARSDGSSVPALLPAPEPAPEDTTCNDPPPDLSNWSIARVWNEQTLGAIRRALPEPTVHARNLYHVSLALHDAWAVFAAGEAGLVHAESARAPDDGARTAAMSHAAFRLLMHRYAHRTGGPVSVDCFRRAMVLLDLDPDDDDLEGPSPAALGNRIGQAVIDAFAQDGSHEHLDYTDPDYRYGNPALVVDDPGIDVDDIDTWQPLDLAVAVTQNGIPEDSGPQAYIGPHWGQVVPFAIRRPAPGVPYFDGGSRPSVHDEEMGEWVEQVIRQTAWLDIGDGVTMDIAPGAYGNNSLGADDGTGHPVNPATGEPYDPQVVLRGDFGRVLAEFWADGPDSETPPGHWNVMAHAAFDHAEFEHRWMGEGPLLERLEWDVRALLALNGALHDAAIVAWEVKRDYESARPVSLIRWMAEQGQRTEPAAADFDPRGLPLVAGLIERITDESSAAGERHAHLAPHVGELALWSWPGDPGDPHRQRSAFRWIRAADWMPYQPRTFVTPAFPGFVSGHSTFSRAAADVLTALTGSAFVPGGLGEFVARQNEYLEFERGPSTDVRLQWATWQDAADQAGQSRIWGGIHVVPDDFVGREMGAGIAARAIAWAEARWGGDGERPGVPTGTPEDIPPGSDPPPSDAFPAPIGEGPDGDDGLEVGTGRSGFETLRHGDPLRWEAGIQGGHHVWVSARLAAGLVENLDDDTRREIRTRLVLTRASGDVLGDLVRLGGYRETDDGWDQWGNFVILRPGIRPGRLDDEPLRLDATVEVPGHGTLESVVWVRSACCD
ncbi:MAG: hypothetical protein EA398_04940 [Deltaproteobacteria bacterium]|nr:MAG: hypothetical protein EA398_04940 [Deltaproteobacteria bacterium]